MMSKKILAVLLSLSMLGSAVSMPVFADENETEQEIKTEEIQKLGVEWEDTGESINDFELFSNDMQLSSISGNDIISYAEQYLGKPYVWGGNGPNSFDCTGFVKYVYNHFGINVPRGSRDWGKSYSNYGTQITNMSNLQKGDVLLFGSSAGSISHAGLYYGNNKVLHAFNSSTGVVVTDITGTWGVNPPYQFGVRINGVSSGSIDPPVHTHNWSYANESAHPHKQYRTCSCGAKEYTGATQHISSCSSCYPVGNARLTRSFQRTQKWVVFYRNNVSNADSYTLTLYRNNNFYKTYNMPGTDLTIRDLDSGTYYGMLTARNSNTGQSRTVYSDNFTLVDTYQVRFDANGGTNAPSAQTKIQNENLTLTSSKPTRAHYIFKGWASSKTATEPQYEPGSYYTKNTPITLYAVWEPETYTINFNVNDGKPEVPSTTITYGDTMKMPNTVVRDNYYLKGWAKNKSATNPDYRIGIDYALDENMTLYAVWGNSTWGGTVATGFAGGDGTEENPYQISNAGELAYLSKIVNEQSTSPEYRYYILTDNINLGFSGWRPIGLAYNEYQYFYGSFDGNGYTISDLKISEGNEGSIGLFGKAKNSEIKNLNINGEISGMTLSNTAYIGAVVGNADNSSISGCNALYVNISDISNTASTYSYMGAICGYASGTISGCGANESSIAMKDGYLYTGIIAGYIKGNVTDCEINSSGRLFGSNTETDNLYLGGICGYLDGNAEKCIVKAGHYSNTLKAKQSYIGGVTGYSTETINLCTAQFDKGSSKNIDGGSYPSSIYAEGSSTSRIGGITGYIAKGGKVTNCKYDGQSISSVNTAGTADVGGIAGQVYGNETTKITAQGGQSLSRSSLPTRSGYAATWYTDANLTKEYDFSQPVTEDMTLYAKWTEGGNDIEIWDGTSEEPAYNADTKTYTVTNGKELAWVSDVTNGVITTGTNFPESTSFEGYTIELANDIYLNDITDVENWETTPPANEWKPIGKDNNSPFSGTFHGNSCQINGIYIYDSSGSLGTYAGFMGYSKGIIQNITIRNGLIYSGEFIGGICGYAENATISNCVNYATLSSTMTTDRGYSEIGGIIGKAVTTNISNCSNHSDISFSTPRIAIFSDIGGIVGSASDDSKIHLSYNTGKIFGSCNVGGIAGELCSMSSISYCYNDANVSSNSKTVEARAGGIVGTTTSSGTTISYCYNLRPIYSRANFGGKSGGIAGIIFTGSTNGDVIRYCYSAGIATSYNTNGIEGGGGITDCIGHTYLCDAKATIQYCYANQTPIDQTDTENSCYPLTYVAYKSDTEMKTLSNLTGFSASDWGINSSINNGYPYLKSLEDTYKTYNITVVEDPENAALLNKCFVNVNGILFSQSTNRATAGGAVGFAGLSSAVNSAPANNLLVIANRVSALTSGSSYKAQAGKIIGSHNYNALDFNNITSFDEMEVSAVNSANASNKEINSITGAEKQLSQITQERSLTQIFGPNTYQSLADLEEHPDAVWVIKNGKLPDLYYNLLRDINISDTVNGTISVDKEQAVDDEIVTVTATPNEGYQLNKIYVNGEEIVGTTFEVNGNSDVYATFTEETPEYNVKISAIDNASASLVNVDAVNLSGFSLMSADDITATDGDEIKVNTAADDEYTVDAIYVNGEELAGDSFIITEDSLVTMDVKNISTNIKATTGNATNIGNYFATLSGSVEGDENTVRYIRYWAKDNPDEVFTTEPENGSGEYSVAINNLTAGTEYKFQMTESGNIKSFFTTNNFTADSDIEGVEPDNPPTTDVKRDMCFDIQNQSKGKFSISADVVNTTNEVQSGLVIFVAYDDNGTIVKVEAETITDLTANATFPVEFAIADGAEKYKILVWDSWKSMLPIATSVDIE